MSENTNNSTNENVEVIEIIEESEVSTSKEVKNEAKDKETHDKLKKDSKEAKEKKKVKVKNPNVTDSNEETLNFRCEQFFGKNWKYVTSFIAIAILVIAYELSNISSKMEHLEKVVYENNGKVVLTTSDGRAIKVSKEPLRAEYLKQFAISVYVNNFLVSRSQLTDDFQRPSFKNYEEVFANLPALKSILTDFIDSKPDKERNIVVNTQAVGDLRAYVQWLIASVAQDKLPEYIVLKDYSVEKYEYQGNKYSISLNIKVATQNYILSEDKFIAQNGTFKIESSGSFDLSKSSDINPYGMRIDRLKITPVIKSGQ